MSYPVGKDKIKFCPFCGKDWIRHLGNAVFYCDMCNQQFQVTYGAPITKGKVKTVV